MIRSANIHLFLDRREELVSEFIADIGSEVGYIFGEWDEIKLMPIISCVNQYIRILDEIRQLIEQTELGGGKDKAEHFSQIFGVYSGVLFDNEVNKAITNLLFTIISNIYDHNSEQFQFFKELMASLDNNMQNHLRGAM
tara:strand:- start:48 stop:464 length:417 start_codon:yes stop_codon:yes gene_type:complete